MMTLPFLSGLIDPVTRCLGGLSAWLNDHLPSLPDWLGSEWAGAVAGLRLIVFTQAAFIFHRYLPSVPKLARVRFKATEVQMDRPYIAGMSFFVVAWSAYSIIKIIEHKPLGSDAAPWSRLLALTSYLVADLSYTLLIAGITNRASGELEARRQYTRIAWITTGFMVSGAALAALHR